jgi:hypothetical protein
MTPTTGSCDRLDRPLDIAIRLNAAIGVPVNASASQSAFEAERALNIRFGQFHPTTGSQSASEAERALNLPSGKCPNKRANLPINPSSLRLS